MQRTNLILLAGLAALLAGGCTGHAGRGGYDSPGDSSQERQQGASGTVEKKPRDSALLRPGESRPGLLHIRREGSDYTLEILLDTSSVNTVYDIELPDREE